MKTFFLGVTVIAVCAWIYYDHKSRKPLSTSEWCERMRKLNLGV
jgi:hypothetical protein